MTIDNQIILDAITGEVIVIELPADEIAARQELATKAETAKAEAEAKAEAAKAEATAKLTALGLTTDDLKALGL